MSPEENTPQTQLPDAKAARSQRKARQRQLTPRDIWVLTWIGEMYAVRGDQLQELLSREPGQRNKLVPGPQGITRSARSHLLARWQEPPALVYFKQVLRRGPGWIWLTPHAERELDLSYKEHHLRPSRLMHRYYINRVRLDYERRHPDDVWKSERALLAELPKRGPDERVPHVPDGEVHRVDGRVFAIEIELSPKGERQIDRALSEMLAGEPPRYTGVWYFVSGSDPVSAQAWRVAEQARGRLPVPLQRRMQLLDLQQIGGAHEHDAATSTTDQ